MKYFVASFSRASNGALSLLKERLEKEGMLTESVEDAYYIIAVGDRWETLDFVLPHWRAGKHIIHLWAGECTPGCEDEVHRHAITLMSDLQLCTNEHAKKRVEALCKVGGMEPNAIVVGNVMMENMELDERVLKDGGLEKGKYDLVLYNPYKGTIEEDLKQIFAELLEGELETLEERAANKDSGKIPYIWIRPNTDRGYEMVMKYATCPSQSRPRFLALIKNCRKFITNSSCEYYEAPFLIKKKQIKHVGLRNAERESKYAKMDIPNASENIIGALKELERKNLEKAQNKRQETY